MSGEIVHRSFSIGVQRRHGKDLARIDQQEELVRARLHAIGNATRAGISEAVQTEMLAAQAAKVAPGATYIYDMIAFGAGVEMMGVIGDLRRPGR